jgi:hypothetical protein
VSSDCRTSAGSGSDLNSATKLTCAS